MTARPASELKPNDLISIKLSEMNRLVEGLRENLEMAELAFNSIHDGAVVTDVDGYITQFNEPYGRFLGVDPKDQIGKHVTEVIENTRMHMVAKTGRSEINVTQRIEGHEMVVQRIPIIKNDRVVAVFGQVMFKDVKDVRRLARKLSLLESKVKLYEEELASIRSTRYTIDSIVGVSPEMVKLKREAAKTAATKMPVLITGESGTGKELFAQGMHHASGRRMRPFVRVNCAAIPRELFNQNFSYTPKAPLPGRATKANPVSSNWPTAAQYFWMKSAICPSSCSLNSCVCWRKGNSSV